MDSLSLNYEEYRFSFDGHKNEYNKYVIKAWHNGKRYEYGDYYTDDYDDAVYTMNLLRISGVSHETN